MFALAAVDGTSLLDPGIKTMLTETAGKIVPTVLEVAVIVVPIGIACWALSLALKKGVGHLQKKASKAL